MAAGTGDITVDVADGNDRVAGVHYEVSVPLRNQNQVILPDSGRWFMDGQAPISAWRFHRSLHSGAEDVRTPLYVCTGVDGWSRLGLGLVSELHECDFDIVEPVSNRALNVHTGRFAVRFRLGSADFPLRRAEPGTPQRVTARVWLHRPEPRVETWCTRCAPSPTRSARPWTCRTPSRARRPRPCGAPGSTGPATT
ncbi:hypothetical protein NKH77_31850 [Streptomyces sp. M19]